MKDGDGKAGYGEIKYRAQHGGLVFITFKDGRGQGRWEDALSYQMRKLLEDSGLTEAAKAIHDGWAIQTAGLGAVVQNFLKVPGGQGGGDWAEEMLIAYGKWSKEVALRYGMAARQDAISIVCHGEGLGDIDRKRNQTNGKAKQNLVNCLMLYQRAR